MFDLACGTLVEHESAACYGQTLELECPVDEVLYVHDVMAYSKLTLLGCPSFMTATSPVDIIELCCHYDSETEYVIDVATDCGKR